MADKSGKTSRLTALELPSVDLMITALEAAALDTVGKDDNPRDPWAEAWVDSHCPFVELGERDGEILREIRKLAGQFSSRTPLRDLVNL